MNQNPVISVGRGAAFAVAAIAGLGFATPVSAQTANSTLNVTATVTANCTVSTSPVAFGTVNPISGSNIDSTGGVTVTCTNGTGWTAAAGVGSGSGATLLSRRMTAGGNTLTYNLFTDAARSTIWGDGTGTTVTVGNTGTGSGQSFTVYGRVGSGQTSVPPGSYADTVSVTVSY